MAQTSARAELYCIKVVATRLGGETTVWTDHQAIEIIYNDPKGLDKVHLLANGDLWAEIRAACRKAGQHKMNIKWCNSHTGAEDRDPTIPHRIYDGNEVADEFAAKGAEAHQVNDYLVKETLEWHEKPP